MPHRQALTWLRARASCDKLSDVNGRDVARVAVLVAGSLAASACTKDRTPSTEPTFARDVAPIVYARCTPCHRPEQAAPFAFIDYDDVKAHAEDIAEVVRERIMPPWRPVRGYGAFANDRSLDDAQVETIVAWVKAGAPPGDLSQAPPPPRFDGGWRLGPPDLVVEMPQPYVLAAEGEDVYRNFVLDPPVKGRKYVAAWDFDPGNAPAVHHAIVNLDREGMLAALESNDGQPGVDGMDLPTASPDGFYLVWAPGNQPNAPVEGRSWRLDGTTDLVLQLHLQPTGRPEPVQSRIALYFADRPSPILQTTLRVGDKPIDIKPGEKDFRIEDSLTVPVSVELLSAFPHAHYLGKETKVWAVDPSGKEVPLLHIDDWDFSWQDKYVFREPVRLPAGSVIHMYFTYDNSAENPRNPNRPPIRVKSGLRSVDEMGNVTFEARVANPEAHRTLRIAKYERALERDGTAVSAYNLGNAYAGARRIDDAVTAYRRAIELDPKLFNAHYNLGNVFKSAGRLDEAEAAYLAALEVREQSVAALVNLGLVHKNQGRRSDAQQRFEQAIGFAPNMAAAHANLGVLHRESKDFDEAAKSFARAAKLSPKNVQILRLAAQTADAAGKTSEAVAFYERTLDVRDDVRDRTALGILLARAGRLKEATEHFRRVVAQQPSFEGGRRNLVQVLRQQGLEAEAQTVERGSTTPKP
ncbi:MAG: tetratricopeptide repeat protein [Deltaproteobacteria bacterium]